MFEAPSPAKPYLAVDKALAADQEDPLYVSVHANTGEVPPNANAAVFVPAPAKKLQAQIIAPPADHVVPLYASVHAYLTGCA